MRLSEYEINSIKSSFNEIFASGKITLFGSRVDDAQKGGDIDLYIDPFNNKYLLEKKINFLVKLKGKIGEQKIDVIFKSDKNRLIDQEAIKNGIEL